MKETKKNERHMKIINGKWINNYFNNKQNSENKETVTQEEKDVLEAFFNIFKQGNYLNSNFIGYLNFQLNKNDFANENKFEIDLFSVFSNKDQIVFLNFERKNLEFSIPNQNYEYKMRTYKQKFLQKIKFLENCLYSKVNKKEIIVLSFFSWKDANKKNNYIWYSSKELNEQNTFDQIFNKEKNVWLKRENVANLFKYTRSTGFLASIFSDENKLVSMDKKTEEHLSHLLLREKKKIIFIEGPAGSGKTTIAIDLFKTYYENAFLWILNMHFCRNIRKRITKIFPTKKYVDKIFWSPKFFNDEQWKNDLKEKKNILLIVDEAQRFDTKTFLLIKDFLKYENISIIFLGDEEQAIYWKDIGLTEIKKELKEYEANSGHISIKNDLRLPNKIKNAIFYILHLINGDPLNYKFTNLEYEIIFPKSESEFIHLYNIDKLKKDKFVLMTTLINQKEKERLSDTQNINLIDKNIPSEFLDDPNFLDNKQMDAFHMLSREIDISYLYLDIEFWEYKIYDENNHFFTFKKEVFINTDNYWSTSYYMPNLKNPLEIECYIKKTNYPWTKKQLNVLLTRATQKLVIFIKNEKFRNECIKRLNKLKKEENEWKLWID